MKRLLPLLLAFFSLAAVLRAQDTIEVETKFVESSSDLILPHDMAALARMKGVDLLSAPRVSSKPGQKATVEIVNEHALPAGNIDAPDPVNTGVSLEVVAVLRDDVSTEYRVRLTKCDLVKAADSSGGTLETVSRDLYATGTAKDGEPIWLRFASPRAGQQLLVAVTFTRSKM